MKKLKEIEFYSEGDKEKVPVTIYRKNHDSWKKMCKDKGFNSAEMMEYLMGGTTLLKKRKRYESLLMPNTVKKSLSGCKISIKHKIIIKTGAQCTLLGTIKTLKSCYSFPL